MRFWSGWPTRGVGGPFRTTWRTAFLRRWSRSPSPTCPATPQLEGKSLAEAARRRGASSAQTLCDLLLEEQLKVGYLNAPPSSTALWQAIDRDCLQLLARPDAMACSDITPLGSAPHPRCYGAFPRFLGRLRRRYRTLSLVS